MLEPIFHRGPDDRGTWQDPASNIALGHQRLSIVDLSCAGRQPMLSYCGRFVIVFNGEIYNHLELRQKLDRDLSETRAGWKGHSDTETLLECFAAWGVEKTLQMSIGMFALALWDRREHSLVLARDRIGEKPLYYGWQRESLLFGSELKSLRAHPDFEGKLHWPAANSFLHSNYIPAPYTIYQDVFKLPPGTFLRITPASISTRGALKPTPYWSLGQAAREGSERPFSGSFRDAVDELERLLQGAVQGQSIADVPVGAFLSGGIDSSVVVAMMKASPESNVTTFSIGMPDPRLDESGHAAAVAKHLGTNHIAHIIRPQEVLELIPSLSSIWDEPFADSSQIPTYLVSRLASQHVTVALSGDGGDEFFLGYPRYQLYSRLWRSRYLRTLPWNTLFAVLSQMESPRWLRSSVKRAQSVVGAWRQPDIQALQRYWSDHYRGREFTLNGDPASILIDLPQLSSIEVSAGVYDAATYLPDDILVKVDRASMANSLETRAPLLDHRIIEFALSLPLSYKSEKGIGKKVLREVLYRHVPSKIVDRPKMGFSIPLSQWLRFELREWADELMSRIPKDDEHFNKANIDLLWHDHLSGRRDNAEQLWGILMLIQFMKL